MKKVSKCRKYGFNNPVLVAEESSVAFRAGLGAQGAVLSP